MLGLLLASFPGIAIPRVVPAGPSQVEAAGPDRSSLSPADSSVILDALGEYPLRFEANYGQFDESVRFAARHGGSTFFFTPQEVAAVFGREERHLSGGRGALAHRDVGPKRDLEARSLESPDRGSERLALRIQFVGASPAPHMEGLDRLPGVANYFVGSDPANWQQGVPSYSGILYHDLYPSIDLRYYDGGGRLKYDFVLHSGADVGRIALDYAGAEGLRLNGAGQLEIETAWGMLVEEAPVAWQEGKAGEREPVAVRYELRPWGTVGFRLGRYDPARPLVIDPGLDYSTLVGATEGEGRSSLALDGAGNAIVTGYTASPDFPTTAGAYDATRNGSWDAFVFKLAAGGGSLLYSTFVGGSEMDQPYVLVVDGAGNAVVTGYTHSPDFPATGGAYDTSLDGRADVFVFKLAADGGSLQYSTFVGGRGGESGCALTLDGNGNAVVAGWTGSSDFPTTAGAYDTTYNGSGDAFVFKLAADGSSLLYSTRVGGSGGDQGNAVALDSAGNVVVTGGTQSSEDFPTTAGAYDTSHNGGNYDTFVSKLSVDAGSLLYSTFVGGSGMEVDTALALDSAGNPVVAAWTWSWDFPTTAGAYDNTYNGSYDVVVFKLAADGGSLLYSTFVGGSSYDGYWSIGLGGLALALDSTGNAVVAGWTESSDFPTTTDAYDPSYNGQGDVFVFRLASDGGLLLYSTFVGGTGGWDYARALALDRAGNAVITGGTVSSDFPTTAGSYDTTHNGSSDVFVFKMTVAAQVGLLEVIKNLQPDDDTGKFNLQIDGATDPDAQEVGNGGSTGKETVDVGTHTVGETAGTGIDLTNYTSAVECRDEGGAGRVVASSDDAGPLDIAVAENDDIICTITNESLLNQPPNCSNAYPSRDTLWPPNHKFVTVDMLGVTDPDGDLFTITIESIFQDEPVDGKGDGSHAPDGKGVGTSTAEVRAERAGTKRVLGNGRVYHILLTAEDEYGATCSGEVLVGVPHDRRGEPAVDDGALYDSTVP